MRGSSFLEKAALLAGLAGNVDAFWRMPCLARSGVARIDPLVDFGGIAQHVHYIHGSSGFGPSADYDDLMAGNCTSCQVSQDKSAYWTPSLYFKHAATGKFELVPQVGGMLAYYLLNGENIKAFPKNFAMIAGNNDLRNFSNYPVPDIPKSNWNKAPYNTQDFLRQAALGFNCLNYAGNVEGSLYRHFLPDKAYIDANCVDGVRFELMFPSCWNQSAGVSPADGKSHMAYPSEVMTGTCPEGFDTRLPSLFYETNVFTGTFEAIPGEFVFSNGDPTGYGYHGDFIMGWDEAFLQQAVDTCTNLSGKIEDCPLFHIQSSSVYGTCNITLPAALADEDVVGPRSGLPGGCAIQSGPGLATGAMAGVSNTGMASAPASSAAPSSAKGSSTATATETSAIVPTLSHSAGSTIIASLGQSYVPGGVFVAVESGASYTPSDSSASSTSYSSGANAILATPAPSLDVSSESFYSKSYSTTTVISDLNEKVEVFEVLWTEKVVTVTATPSVGVEAKRRRHLHEHARKRGGSFA